MDWTFLQRWIIAGLCILCSGCTVWDDALRTTRYEPSLFSYKHDRRRSLAVYRRWADEAWQQQWQAAPELGDRPAYGQGFRDGFVDYTFAGGTGEPPAVPPRKLWNVFYRNEEGHQSTADWFAGYRHGAQPRATAVIDRYRRYARRCLVIPTARATAAIPRQKQRPVMVASRIRCRKRSTRSQRRRHCLRLTGPTQLTTNDLLPSRTMLHLPRNLRMSNLLRRHLRNCRPRLPASSIFPKWKNQTMSSRSNSKTAPAFRRRRPPPNQHRTRRAPPSNVFSCRCPRNRSRLPHP